MLNYGEKKLELVNKIDKKTIIKADKLRIVELFDNLISNAVKFSYSGGVVNGSSKSKGKFIEISISDKGIGISNEHVKTIFNINRNFRAKGTADERGSGLGLILCKEFVERNKGKISVESTEGEGAIFSISFSLSNKIKQN